MIDALNEQAGAIKASQTYFDSSRMREGNFSLICSRSFWGRSVHRLPLFAVILLRNSTAASCRTYKEDVR